MKKLKIKCVECESVFILQYDPHSVDNDPIFCPWCAEYFSTDDNEKDEDEEDEEGIE